MAGVETAQGVRTQVALIAALRWRLLRNSLRTLRGRLELVSTGVIAAIWAVFVLASGVGLGALAFVFVEQGKSEWLTPVLWGIFILWQFTPLFTAAFSVQFDFSSLLRFPVRFSSFVLLALAYGVFDPASLTGVYWLGCMALGIALAAPGMFPGTVGAFLMFAAVNIALDRMIFAWLERWLARRRSREALAAVLLLFFLCLQLFAPAAHHWAIIAHWLKPWLPVLLPAAHGTPPGLAAAALAGAAAGNVLQIAGAIAGLVLYGMVFGALFVRRLRAQYRGESLGESLPPAPVPIGEKVRLGWRIGPLSGPAAAVFEKELRYLSRSGPMLLNLVVPVILLIFFGFSAGGAWGDSEAFFGRVPNLIFPIGVAYALIILMNMVYNSFGYEARGVQFLFVSPAAFREVLLGKNLAHAGVAILESCLIWAVVGLLFRPPGLMIVLVTFAGLLLALPINLGVGNLISLYFPRRFDYSVFGRQRASGMTALASLLVQVVLVGLISIVVVLARVLGRLWLAPPVLLGLATLAAWAYFLVLERCNHIALAQRDVLTGELCR